MKLATLFLQTLWSMVVGGTFEETTIEISMPGFGAVQDSYVCTSIGLDDDVYLREVTPFGNLDSIHHMQLAKCGQPGENAAAAAVVVVAAAAIVVAVLLVQQKLLLPLLLFVLQQLLLLLLVLFKAKRPS